MASFRFSSRKSDQQNFPEILEAIKSNKFSVVRPTGARYKSEETWSKWRFIYDESNKVLKDYYYCSWCEAIYKINIANSGKCLKRHAVECSAKDNNSMDEHFFKSFNAAKKRKIAAEDRTAVKMASMDFVVGDMRPIYSIDGDGLNKLLAQMTSIGAKYGEMSVEDSGDSKLIPSRFTVPFISYTYSH